MWAPAFAIFLLCLTPYSCATEQQPAARIDLHPFGYQTELWGDTAVRFSGLFLLVYADNNYTRTMRLRLAFNTEARQLVSQKDMAGLSLPDESRLRMQGGPSQAHIVARWKQMMIEEVVTVASKGPDRREYYLHEPDREKLLLFGGRCPSDSPNFLGDDRILIHLCNHRHIVVDKKGRKIYDLPALSLPYIAPALRGDRFVVYERDTTLFHQFEGTNRLRVKVFRSSDGKKLFEYRWTPSNERTNDGRVALSDDGSLVALVQAGEILIFTLPPHD